MGDDIQRVRSNKVSALAALEIDPASVYDVYQIHSREVVMVERPLMVNEAHIKADGMITKAAGVSLLMRFADCVPILFYDPVHHAAGICHAGWMGTELKIAEEMVHAMSKHFATRPDQIIAAIGPSIGPDHYFIKPDVAEKVATDLGEIATQVLTDRDGLTYLDLWKANQIILNNAGVYNIETPGLCTQCHMDDWYSHRGENGKTGRFGIVIVLNN